MPFGLQMLGPLRGDEGLLATAKALETLFDRDADTARPRPDMAALAASNVDLREIVTHPPVLKTAIQATTPNIRTAV